MSTSRRQIPRHTPLRLPRDCGTGNHVAKPGVTIDRLGVEHGRCRYCGCELTRLPVLRRWYRTGEMG